MAQTSLNSTGVASSGALSLQSNGTTEAIGISTAQVATFVKDAVVNGLTVGRGAGAVSNNTAVGASALATNSTGVNITALGKEALYTVTGSNNTAVGAQSAKFTTTGTENNAVGVNALYSNTTGSSNVAVGHASLFSNTTATGNTAVGYQALTANTTGADLAAFGYQALRANTTGATNVAFGFALAANTTGSDNSAVGWAALYANTTGASNTALGRGSLFSNTTASNNTAVGYQAGYSGTTGTYNVFMGYTAGYNNTSSYNTYVGEQAGLAATSGTVNTYIGAGAGQVMTTGSKNTIIGGYQGNSGGLDIRTASNYIVLSDGDGNPRIYVTSSGGVAFGAGTTSEAGFLYLQGTAASGNGPVLFGRTGTLGSTTDQWAVGSNSWIKGGTAYNTLTCTAGSTYSGGVNLTSGATSWASASDSRLKNVTGTYTNALADIAQIEAVKFTWKDDEEAKPQVGVIAQSVQGVVPEAIDMVRVSKDDETDYLSVKYTELIPLMIASIQELKAEFDAYKATHP